MYFHNVYPSTVKHFFQLLFNWLYFFLQTDVKFLLFYKWQKWVMSQRFFLLSFPNVLIAWTRFEKSDRLTSNHSMKQIEWWNSVFLLQNNKQKQGRVWQSIILTISRKNLIYSTAMLIKLCNCHVVSFESIKKLFLIYI